jgi:hypothetical protein
VNAWWWLPLLGLLEQEVALVREPLKSKTPAELLPFRVAGEAFFEP